MQPLRHCLGAGRVKQRASNSRAATMACDEEPTDCTELFRRQPRRARPDVCARVGWTEEGGAADVLAAQASTDRETVLNTLAPAMMQLHTGRLVDPQEIADAVLLLASPRSGSTSGTELVIDGGMVKAA